MACLSGLSTALYQTCALFVGVGVLLAVLVPDSCHHAAAVITRLVPGQKQINYLGDGCLMG